MPTSQNSLNANQQGLQYQNAGVWTGLDGGTLGNVMTSNGPGVAPSFQAGGGGGGVSQSNGTWTPTVTGSGTPGTTTYGVQQGSWNLIGNLVYVQGVVQVTNATGVGSAEIGGLPFPINPATNAVDFIIGSVLLEGTWDWSSGGFTYAVLLGAPNTTTCVVFLLNSTGGAGNLGMTNGTEIFGFSLTYMI